MVNPIDFGGHSSKVKVTMFIIDKCGVRGDATLCVVIFKAVQIFHHSAHLYNVFPIGNLWRYGFQCATQMNLCFNVPVFYPESVNFRVPARQSGPESHTYCQNYPNSCQFCQVSLINYVMQNSSFTSHFYVQTFWDLVLRVSLFSIFKYEMKLNSMCDIHHTSWKSLLNQTAIIRISIMTIIFQ